MVDVKLIRSEHDYQDAMEQIAALWGSRGGTLGKARMKHR